MRNKSKKSNHISNIQKHTLSNSNMSSESQPVPFLFEFARQAVNQGDENKTADLKAHPLNVARAISHTDASRLESVKKVFTKFKEYYLKKEDRQVLKRQEQMKHQHDFLKALYAEGITMEDVVVQVGLIPQDTQFEGDHIDLLFNSIAGIHRDKPDDKDADLKILQNLYLCSLGTVFDIAPLFIKV